MLIGIDASRANRTHKSGTEWYSFHVIKELAKLDNNNQYILYTDQPLTDGLIDLADTGAEAPVKFDQDGYQILNSPHNNFKAKILNWPFRIFWTQGRLSLEMLLHRPDILFVPAHALPIIHPKNSVVTIHDIGFKREQKLYEQEKISHKKSRLLNLFVRIFTLGKYGPTTRDYINWSTEWTIKHAQKIITISEFSKNEILHFYKTLADKIKVIHNGYDQKLYQRVMDQKKLDDVLIKYGIKKPFMVYIGRLEKKKNTSKLIEAFAILRQKHPELDYKLCLVGDASFGYDEVKYTLSEHDLLNEVITTGWVEENDIPAILSGAEVFVFPSNYEGFGIPLLQAMACGCPIVASQTSSIPEVVGEAGILFDPNDVYDMAEKMFLALKDNNQRQKIVELGYERVKNFSWNKCAREILNNLIN